MNATHPYMKSPQLAAQQNGVALIVGLVILLVLTIIGIAAIKGSTQQERMASNFQQQSQTFQTAESSIRLVMGHLAPAPLPSPAPVMPPRPRVDLSLSPGITYNTDILSIARAGSAWTAATATPPATGSGIVRLNSSAVAADGTGFNGAVNFYYTGGPGARVSGYDLNKYSAFSYEINAMATQPATGARSNNIQGIYKIVPKQVGF